jgi:outer membrane immunogenic protein
LDGLRFFEFENLTLVWLRPLIHWGNDMKRLVVALTAIAALTAPALAADMAPRYAKAPAPVAPVYNWTGFYIFGGAGGGVYSADSNLVTNPGGLAFSRDQRMGGDGWFGTVGIGYDWQFNGPWVAGIFGDGQFGNIRGSISDPFFGVEGRQKLETSYAAGIRVGYLIAPNVLSYVNGGYSGSEWSGASYSTLAAGGGPTLFTTPSFQRNGWFVGGGVENNLDIFGIRAPGWFMKTEYRSAFYDRVTLPETLVGGGITGNSVTYKPWVQTVSTSLVYRFNWGR